MDDLALFAHALDGTRAFGRLVGLSRGSEVHELEGVTATLVPRCPERSVVNSVSYDDADALAAVLDELAGIYAAAGVSRWTVWVPQQDRGAAELLERAGHVLDAEPAAMGLDLGSLPDLPAEPPGWERAEDAAAVGPLNDAAYGYEGSFTRALDGVPTGTLDVWVAHDEGRPVTCLMTLDRNGGDRHVTLVATAPEARGRGLASALLATALADAREQGLQSSSLIATRMGAPMYERLGYRAVGTVQMWERREAG